MANERTGRDGGELEPCCFPEILEHHVAFKCTVSCPPLQAQAGEAAEQAAVEAAAAATGTHQ